MTKKIKFKIKENLTYEELKEWEKEKRNYEKWNRISNIIIISLIPIIILYIIIKYICKLLEVVFINLIVGKIEEKRREYYEKCRKIQMKSFKRWLEKKNKVKVSTINEESYKIIKGSD